LTLDFATVFNGIGNQVLDGFSRLCRIRTLDIEGLILVNQLVPKIYAQQGVNKSSCAGFFFHGFYCLPRIFSNKYRKILCPWI